MMEKVTMFVGLNDKDSKQQEINTIDAFKLVSRACMVLGGCTISEAIGYYEHDDGTPVIEKSLRIECIGVSLDDCRPVINQLKTLLNQEAIAVQFENINSVML